MIENGVVMNSENENGLNVDRVKSRVKIVCFLTLKNVWVSMHFVQLIIDI